MSTTKGDTIARIRRLVKGLKADAFLTDRFLYSMVLSIAKTFIKRKDDSNKLVKNSSLFQKLPGVGLEEVSRIEAGCIDVLTCCTVKRTEKLPVILEGSMGPLIRSVTSVDGSQRVWRTTARDYFRMRKSTTFKYNKNIYYWISDNRIYFPAVEWDVIDIEAMWENDITEYRCDNEDCCVDRRSELTNIPDDLFPDIEEPVRQKLLGMIQIPKDNLTDNQSLQKS